MKKKYGISRQPASRFQGDTIYGKSVQKEKRTAKEVLKSKEKIKPATTEKVSEAGFIVPRTTSEAPTTPVEKSKAHPEIAITRPVKKKTFTPAYRQRNSTQKFGFKYLKPNFLYCLYFYFSRIPYR